MKLAENQVKFDEEKHIYELGGKRLMGITELIHKVKGLGNYEDAEEYVRNIAIPKAGAKGTALHQAIEMFDTMGIEMTQVPVVWKEGLTGIGHEDVFDVAFQISAYKEHKEKRGMVALANEYCVTDGEKWASNIDNVWAKPKAKNKVTLVDTKTNNLELYPGGKNALKEYLSWQLSIYAYLFEKQNPTLKVDSLGCNWLTKSKAEYWKIDRKKDKEVEELLATEWEISDGKVKYYQVVDGEKKYYENVVADIAKPNITLDEQTMLDKVAQLQNEFNKCKLELELAKLQVTDMMKAKGFSKYDCDLFKVSYTPESTTSTFDSKKFKEDNPELYSKYVTQSFRKESLRITINKN